MFDMVNNPTFSIYTGEDPMWGVDIRDGKHGTNPAERQKVYWQNHVELSRYLLKGLMKRGFDMANLASFESRGKLQRGVSHMLANAAPEVNPLRDIPTIGIFINEYFPPLPTAERCAQLGEAIRDVLADRPERIAIYASGGLSHFPGMFNAGWIDTALDHWILERLERNDVDALKNLFTMDSDMMRAGTGEVRAWISVAAAMNRPAKVVDYVPAHSTVTGNAFAYWPPVETQTENDRTYSAARGAQ
jgi:protocatechuate 4,5-dioxygenase beta chain